MRLKTLMSLNMFKNINNHVVINEYRYLTINRYLVLMSTINNIFIYRYE